MVKKDFGILVLAAGLGTRMKSGLPKMLHPVAGMPMIGRILKTIQPLKSSGICLVVGHEAGRVRQEILSKLDDWGIKAKPVFVEQKFLKGSGRAVQEAAGFVKKHKTLLVMCGDSPLITAGALSGMLETFFKGDCRAVVLTAKLADPYGYGRVMRSIAGVSAIVEESELDGENAGVNEVNSGIYVFDSAALAQALKELKPKGPKKEFYLTDVIESIASKGGKILPFVVKDPDEILGVNSRKQLAYASSVINKRTLDRLMAEGVTIADPDSTYVDETVKIGRDSVIYAGTHITGKTEIGENSSIGPYVLLENSRLGREVKVKFFCCVYNSRILDNTVVGPFSHIRPGCVIGPSAKIGNFTEVKASTVGRGSKVPHLSYIGDTEMADGINIGAGTITCNYDGVEKHKTIIGAGAFIRSNINLVAPVKIGRRSKIGAGSTITDDVPAETLAIARARQIVLKKR